MREVENLHSAVGLGLSKSGYAHTVQGECYRGFSLRSFWCACFVRRFGEPKRSKIAGQQFLLVCLQLGFPAHLFHPGRPLGGRVIRRMIESVTLGAFINVETPGFQNLGFGDSSHPGGKLGRQDAILSPGADPTASCHGDTHENGCQDPEDGGPHQKCIPKISRILMRSLCARSRPDVRSVLPS